MLRPTISRLVCLGVKPRLEPKTRFLLLSDSCRSVHVGRPLWREDGVCRLQLLLAITSAVIFTEVKISNTGRLYLQFYMSAFHTVDQVSGFLWARTIYSFTCDSSTYVCTVYTRLGIADHALTHVAHVTTAA
jgi:hypothetical protein